MIMIVICVFTPVVNKDQNIKIPAPTWFGLVWFGFVAYQPLLVIWCQILFLHTYWRYDLYTYFVDTHS